MCVCEFGHTHVAKKKAVFIVIGDQLLLCKYKLLYGIKDKYYKEIN